MKMLLKALVFVLILSGAAKADSLITWDFSFSTVDNLYNSSGTFQTSGIYCSPCSYPIVSLDGTMNGDTMTLVNSYYPDGTQKANMVDTWSTAYPFYYHPFTFSVDGVDYMIYDIDMNVPIAGNVLWSSTGYINEVNLSVTQKPVSTPEASTSLLLVIGLAAMMILWKRKQKCGKPLDIAAN